jgi:hypothetical protein
VHHKGPLSPAERLGATNDARVSLVQLLIAAGVIGGLVYTARTYSLTREAQRAEREAQRAEREAQRAERFTTAIGQIGDAASESVRVGGVYSLALLAAEVPLYWTFADQVLAALIRERAVLPDLATADVQAALGVLGREQRPPEPPGPALDLGKARLTGVKMSSLNLEGVQFNGSVLNRADMTDARLCRAAFRDASMDGVLLLSADLSDADLTGASLRGANFFGCEMKDADVSNCDLGQALNLTPEQLATTSGTPRVRP